ncbi:MAG: Electron transport complex protein RnfC [bacterium ADurb.Bin243]|nr:MAG: Electron transport complex protein RnfC [bacterium ADurb.Bin243]HOD39056.1 electron transport complex subunit RsxC [Candidatus Wallbacteria bacterium]
MAFGLKTFSRGGIHVDDRKYSHESPIEKLPAPKTVVIPISQHIGAPAKAVVTKDQAVKIGQLIAEKSGFISANVLSPVSGIVKAVEARMTPTGFKQDCIVIENDMKDEYFEAFTAVAPSAEVIEKLDISGAVKAVEKAGIVGMGGAAFPTSVKLSPPPDVKIDTVILNGVECEPYLTADARIMIEDADRIVAGLALIMKIFSKNGPVKGYIGIEANKPDSIQKMAEAASKYKDIEVVSLALKYPQGGEKQLINAIVGRDVPSGKLPSAVGCVVQNVATAASIYDAAVNNRPLIERVVTVTGMGVKKQKNLLVRFGTMFTELIDYCGGVTDDASMLICGGPMMGKALQTSEVPVTKAVSGILVLTQSEANLYEEAPCIRCGRCVDVCPMGLQPGLINKVIDAADYGRLEELSLLDCIECGSCNYICAGHERLVQKIKIGKVKLQEILKARKEKEAQTKKDDKK